MGLLRLGAGWERKSSLLRRVGQLGTSAVLLKPNPPLCNSQILALLEGSRAALCTLEDHLSRPAGAWLASAGLDPSCEALVPLVTAPTPLPPCSLGTGKALWDVAVHPRPGGIRGDGKSPEPAPSLVGNPSRFVKAL